MTYCVTKMPVLLLIMSVQSAIEIRRGGLLNRLIQYHKVKFIEDVKKVAPIKINATIIPTPVGYTDSNLWTFESVIHLIILIKESQPPAPVRNALRRMLAPTRRLMMGIEDSYKRFPSLGSIHNIYYDMESKSEDLSREDEYPDESDEIETIESSEDDGVIVVSNPVEAKLPSASISIKLLQNILINRAIAARQMPSTTRMTIPWIPMNITEDMETTETSSVVTDQQPQDSSADFSENSETKSTGSDNIVEQSTSKPEDANPDEQDPEKPNSEQEPNAEEEPNAE